MLTVIFFGFISYTFDKRRTAMIFAVPMVDERAAVSAPNCETSPSASGSFVTESFIALKIYF